MPEYPSVYALRNLLAQGKRFYGIIGEETKAGNVPYRHVPFTDHGLNEYNLY